MPQWMAQEIFTWSPTVAERQQQDHSAGATVHVYGSEAAMLQAWHDFFDESDPDAIPLFQACPFPLSGCQSSLYLLAHIKCVQASPDCSTST